MDDSKTASHDITLEVNYDTSLIPTYITFCLKDSKHYQYL